SDTGVKGDFITQVTTPTFNGTAEAGARLTLAIGSSVYTFAADASGRWSFTLPEQLQDGVHQYTLTATDIAGNISTGTGSVTIDTTGPELTQQIDPSSNNMVSDDVISNSSPVFSGRTEANLIVTITIAGISYNVMADESGNWKFTVPNNLPDGAYSYTVSVTDNAGNVSSSTGQVSVLAQSDSSTLLLTGGLDTTSDTGVTGDNITGCNKPVFT
ncbi:TPA: Ig-like domain repeat protein, partial [Escherichia coli]|nr:Ig-like domain repeat protein [Escherichia coli]